MNSDADSYRSPLGIRYASRGMRENSSDRKKFLTWRKPWIALAESESELGLIITKEQVAELKEKEGHFDLELAAEYKKNCGTMSWLTSMLGATFALTPAVSFTWALPRVLWGTTPI